LPGRIAIFQKPSRAHQVVLADRGAAGGQHDVGPGGPGEGVARRGHVVAGNAEVEADPAPRLDQAGEGDAVGRHDLAGSRGRSRRNQFVAGGQYRHHRPAPHA
jgi:hypothetical protein